MRDEAQINGLTRLLTIALRVLTLIEIMVRGELAKSKESLQGLYEGQPKRKTSMPTAVRLLKAVTRMDLTAIRVTGEGECHGQLTPLPPLLQRIMELLHLPLDVYTCLATES